MPCLMWAYPREYKDAKSASQIKDSPYVGEKREEERDEEREEERKAEKRRGRRDEREKGKKAAG